MGDHMRLRWPGGGSSLETVGIPGVTNTSQFKAASPSRSLTGVPPQAVSVYNLVS